MVPPILQAAHLKDLLLPWKGLGFGFGPRSPTEGGFCLEQSPGAEGGFWWCFLGQVYFWELEGGGMKDVSDKIWSPQLDTNDDGCRRHMTSPAKRLLKARRLRDHNQHSWLENGQFCP